MIAHVVLFKPKHELTGEQRQGVIDALKAAASGIPSVRGLRSESASATAVLARATDARRLRYLVIVEFDDVEGLTAYLAHPQHAAIGSHFVRSASTALAYDYCDGGLDAG